MKLVVFLFLTNLLMVLGFTPLASKGTTFNTANVLYAETKEVKEKQPTLSKSDFISRISDKTGSTKKDSEIALAAVIDVIKEEAAAGKRINISGFGTFKLTYRAARKGRNPRTGEAIDIRESYSPSFSASQTFKDACNPNRS